MMRNLSIVLSAGVLIGLLTYAVLEWQQCLTLSLGDRVALQIHVFVLVLAAMGFGSAALALLFRALLQRTGDDAVRRLEERVAQLEADRRGTGAAARAAEPPPHPANVTAT